MATNPHWFVDLVPLPLMTIGHKAGYYCHFRVLRGVNSDTGRKKREFCNLLGGG